ncbi:MAG: GNAT family acetyltransferase [Lachnospiraceae bacterium]|nr:GNAT family acetyltransferase [Lachnospiraceae bacterium]
MIERKTFLTLDYYKKEAFTGGYRGMRYRIARTEEDGTVFLTAVCWPEPFNYEKTPEEQKIREKFMFGEEGLIQIADWLNERYREGGYDTGY